MSALKLYAALEAVVGRDRLWRIGRWLYLGSRRELRNDPNVNGEYALQQWLQAAAPSPSGSARIFVDVGANIGSWTANLLSTLERAGIVDFVVHCCEPSPAQFATLTKRLDTAAKGRVRFDSRGLGAEPGRASFNITGEESGNGSIDLSDSDNSTFKIDVTTLDSICRENGYQHIDLIKIDTEGNDFNVILGCQGTISFGSISVLQFEYNWRWILFGRSLRDVFEFMSKYPYIIGKLTSDKVEYYSEWHPELDRFIETNYVIVHRDIARRFPHVFMRFNPSNIPVERDAAAGTEPIPSPEVSFAREAAMVSTARHA